MERYYEEVETRIRTENFAWLVKTFEELITDDESKIEKELRGVRSE